ncbi:MAG: imidazoleglycerol-phosphate dehydratase HisB [Methermicoccaceae archaeon]
MPRYASAGRKTAETDISVELGLDGSGRADIDTQVPFLDHMLTSFTVHSGFDLDLRARGDIEVDVHHTVEDVAIVLGGVFDEALSERKNIVRFAHAVVPMDDSLSMAAVDLVRRSYLVFDVPLDWEEVGGVPSELFEHFFDTLSRNAHITLHIIARGKDRHHIMEASFKATALALYHATRQIKGGARSTKGVL